MAKRANILTLVGLHVVPGQNEPLYHQIYRQIRENILVGRLPPGTRLPATRALAAELGISRNTAMLAFELLIAEGYLTGTVGLGTLVAPRLPEELLQAPRPQQPHMDQPAVLVPAQRSVPFAGMVIPPGDLGVPRPFRSGTPALDRFPFALWSRLMRQILVEQDLALFGYQEPAGYRPLREALAGYLGPARAVTCTPEQILIVNGTQQAISLIAQVLLDPGDAVWMEDPGYVSARMALQAAGATLVPVPIDAEGLDCNTAERSAPQARLAYVTPSHQFPLGVTMSLARRLQLLDWAQRRHSWIIEDDYDSEYRYAGRPLSSLQGLDSSGRVLYVGTFSKVLFPSLRLGYLVVPLSLVPLFTAARMAMDRHSPTLEQAVVARFISAGHFARHLRQMRLLYAARQQALVEAAHRDLNGWLELQPHDAGLHLIGWLDDAVTAGESALATLAVQHGVEVTPLSRYSMRPYARRGLILGYACADVVTIRQSVAQLQTVIHSC